MLIDLSEAAPAAGAPGQTRAKVTEGGWPSKDREAFRKAKAGNHCEGGASHGRASVPRRSTVLCIDKDCDRGGSLAGALAQLGYDVLLASDGEEGRRKIGASRPKLVFYDASTLRLEGIESCLELLEHLSQPLHENDALPLVVLTGKQDGEHILYDGRRKTTPQDEAFKAPSPPAEPPAKPLTPRERDVLTWAARGKTSAEIGMILNLSERTINFHCDNAMRRLDVINRTQAVAKAVATGVIGL